MKTLENSIVKVACNVDTCANPCGLKGIAMFRNLKIAPYTHAKTRKLTTAIYTECPNCGSNIIIPLSKLSADQQDFMKEKSKALIEKKSKEQGGKI